MPISGEETDKLRSAGNVAKTDIPKTAEHEGASGQFAHLKAAENTHSDHTTEAQKHMASQTKKD